MSVVLDTVDLGTQGERYPAGHVIFSEGDDGRAMYVVLEGQVELKIGPAITETLGAGEPFGEMALIDNSPRVGTATAKTDCRLARIPEDRFLDLVRDQPYFALQVMQIMAQRLRKMVPRA